MVDKFTKPPYGEKLVEKINDIIDNKQDTLVSGTNIKTINNTSLLGSGNIDIQGGSTVTVDDALSTTSTNPVQNKVITNALDEKADDSAVIKKDGDSAQQTISLSSGTGTTALGVKSRSTTSYISFSSSSKWLGSFGVNASQKPTFYNGTGYTLATLDDIPDISGKQDTLVSGTNIKTINGNSLLGSGNITIESSTPTNMVTTDTNQTISGTKSFTSSITTNMSGALIEYGAYYGTRIDFYATRYAIDWKLHGNGYAASTLTIDGFRTTTINAGNTSSSSKLILSHDSLIFNKSDNTQIDLLAIPTLYTTTGQNTDGTMTQKAITDEMYYAAGEIFTVSDYYCQVAACVTSSKTTLQFNIPLPKQIPSGVTPRITSLDMTGRSGSGGYIISNYTLSDADSVSISYINGNTIWVMVSSSTKYQSITNNTGLVLALRDVTIEFS